jgi:uncharacterized circularly permuted ATP-grasp superfamily protein
MLSRAGYRSNALDEAIGPDGQPMGPYAPVLSTLIRMGPAELARRADAFQELQRSRGITFLVHDEGAERERTLPCDLVPRIVDADEWATLERGLIQRVDALNRFLADIYSEQAIIRDGIVPSWMVLSSPQFQRRAWGIRPPRGVFIHVAGLDLVRGRDGRWQVLEDNLRVPSGASYVIENREVLSRTVPELYRTQPVRPVDHYPALLRDALRDCAPPAAGDDPCIVLLTPGPFNSAYFEHTLLARQMGIPLVEGQDLFCDSDVVYMRTTRGPKRVDVVYRRIDDEYCDPVCLRPDSALGVPGLVGAARAGNVTLGNALGNGVADDKAMMAFVPAMIRYYLGQEPALDQVPTYLCANDDDRALVLRRLSELVVKPVDASGGSGMMIGPIADRETVERFRIAIEADPRRFIAQEVVSLTTHPTLIGGALAPRHIDLRPFIVQGRTIRVLPGGLTRVALPAGSLVVNSSQGGGTKDTWVLARTVERRSEPAVEDSEHVPFLDPDRAIPGAEQQQPQQQQGDAGC